LFECPESPSEDFFDKGLSGEGESEAMPVIAPEAPDDEPDPRVIAPPRRGVSRGQVILAFVLGIVTVLYVTGAYGPLLTALTRNNETMPAISFVIEDMKGAFIENSANGRLFVIKAVIKNTSSEPRNIAAVAGSLYDASGAELMTRMVSAGATLSNEELQTLPKEDIQRHYEDVSPALVPGMGSIAAMVVFTEIPQDMAEFGLEIIR
ncbi:MAG: DUF3426 domain-containing protein, partial [Deltaproteobacteria bacterium]|nr:DUF3426 domain-containing protein [Deltaproteobacteria bacterium]